MKYLGETFDMHGGGMDLMFPHHENELAQSQCATGKPFARFWMHNGLTRIKTKLASGEWADEKMSGSIGNVVPAAQLLDEHGAELLRYFLLSTHYRRPIEFTDEVMANAKKGLSVFHRLFDRIERLGGQSLEGQKDMTQVATELVDGEYADLARSVLAYKMKFLEMMDDDFNTAGAIAVLHELSGEINSFIEKHQLEHQKSPAALAAAAAGTVTVKNLGLVLGLFRGVDMATAARESELTDKLMTLLIGLRREARKDKNFSLADGIRDKLAEIGVTLEDRPDGTIWRKA
jgi:cysteinyl-tRNA synthetase